MANKLTSANLLRATILALAGISACAETDIPAPAVPRDGPKASNIEYSAGFYLGEDGYYHWDGQPPPGDEAPAVVRSAIITQLQPPNYSTGGWVQGEMSWEGDLGQIRLTWTAERQYPAFSTSGSSSSLWKGCGEGRCNPGWTYHKVSLGLQEYKCDITVTAGGTAYAKKSKPFGVPLWLIKIIDAFAYSSDYANAEWGLASQEFTPVTASGPLCDEQAPESACDDAYTTEVEYCPLQGDPGNPNAPGGGSGTTEGSVQTRPEGPPPYSGTMSFGCTELWHMRAYQGGVKIGDWYECAKWGWYEDLI